MNDAENTSKPASGKTVGDSLKTAQRIILGIFLVAIAFAIASACASVRLPVTDGAIDAIVLLLALATTLVSLWRQLPLQNVLLAAVIIGVLGGGIHTLGALTGIPFGPIFYTKAAGPKLFDALAWFFPLLWIVIVLNARGVARLILRPWRKLRVYGFWLIGITTLLTLLFVFGMEPFATRLRHYWVWSPTKIPVDWYGAPLSDFLGWLVATLLILAFATPSLMKKKPSKSVPDYHPLIVWIAVNLLFIAGTVSQHLFASVAVTAAMCIAIIPFAIRGARW